MTTVTNKQRLIQRLCSAPKRTADNADGAERPILEHLLYAICREGATPAQAEKAFQALRKRFFDWNEIRVSAEREVEDVLASLPNPEVRAFRMINLLKELFETTYSFDLDPLVKKGVKQAQKHLERLGASPFVISYTLQNSGGHALPLDADMRRTLLRLEVLDNDGDNDEAVQACLDHLVPKAKGAAFCEMVGEIAQTFCHETAPRCSACSVREFCPTGEKNIAHARSNGAHTAGSKARARG